MKKEIKTKSEQTKPIVESAEARVKKKLIEKLALNGIKGGTKAIFN